MNHKAGRRTMLTSVLMSAPGPLIEGLALTAGRSATQLADFVRRAAELLALVVAYIVYCRTGDADPARRARLERASNGFVGAVMCLSGGVMLLLSLFSAHTQEGSVLPGLTIALLGAVANTIFWLRYAHLSRETGNSILAVQSRLYRAKALVDGCVSAALLAVALFPASPAALRLDRIGSAVVALYLAFCGLQTLGELRKPGGRSEGL